MKTSIKNSFFFCNSRNVILETDYYFERKSEYNISNPCLSKAIIYYIKNNNYIDKENNNVKWIDFNVMNEIYKTYYIPPELSRNI